MLRAVIGSFVLSSSFVLAASAADVTIEQLAPRESIIVFGAKNVAQTIERAKTTPLWGLWMSEDMKSTREDFLKEFNEGIVDMYKELGVEEGSLVPPKGAAGGAVFTVIDDDLGTPKPAILVFADYGEDVEKTLELIQAALKKGEQDGMLRYENKDVRGRNVFAIEIIEPAAAAEDDEWDDDEFMMPMIPGLPSGDDFIKHFKNLNLTRDGDLLLLSSTLDALSDALEIIDGQAGETIKDSETYQKAREQLGDDGDTFVLVFTENIGVLLGGGQADMMMGMVRPSLQALFGDIQAFGFAATVATDHAMIEQRMTIYTPKRAGLLALFDTQTAREELPKFIGPDTISYNVINFEFNGVFDLIKSVVNSNPFLAAQAEMILPEIEAPLDKIATSLGTQVHIATRLTRPLTANSQSTAFAIPCLQPAVFESLLAEDAPKAGFEPRDFLGQRIYSLSPEAGVGSPFSMEQGFSIGIGGGFAVLGPTPAVEQTLRATGQGDLPTLASDPEFVHALSTLPKVPAVGWGYSNFVDSFEANRIAYEQQMKDMADQFRESEPEFAAEMEAQAKDSPFHAISVETLRRYVGPTAWQLRVDEAGFNFIYLTLPPTPKQ